ncbi:STING-like protein [Mya arenaria]|uniref:STING-like protein n=1 Tax=Mya arenaria TaxID=6604 RepID=A0ABY7FZI0_MYAAR|nr:STING-like protein [Mya arenaria]
MCFAFQMEFLRKKKIFIAHNNGDSGLVERYVIAPLKNVDPRDVGFTIECVYDKTHFWPGKTTIDNILDAVQQCVHTFVVITPTSINRQWVRYETQLALERSQSSGRLCVTLILLGIDPREVQDVHGFRFLTRAVLMHADMRRDGWDKLLLRKMLDRIKGDGRAWLGELMVTSNLTNGQVWSHFTGYSRIVLSVLKDRIRSSVWYKENPDRFPLVEFNIIPMSASRVGNLSVWDENIKYVGDLPPVYAERGSFRERPYFVSVYMIEDEGKVFYIAAVVPNTITILNKLEHPEEPLYKGQKEAQPPKMSAGERKLQVAQFHIGLNQLVNHKEERIALSRLILDAIYKGCPEENFEGSKQQHTVIVSRLDDVKYREFYERPIWERSVLISFCESVQSDNDTAEELKEFLKKNKFFVHQSSVGKTEFGDLQDAVMKCKWFVVILSDDAIHDKNYKVLQQKWQIVLHESVLTNEVRVIPILDGINEDYISDDLRALTYISKQEAGYMKRLLQVIKHLHRLEEIQRDHPHSVVMKKLYIVVPSSCSQRALKSLDKDENGRVIDSRFRQMQEMYMHKTSVGGQINRPYQLITYRLQADLKTSVLLLLRLCCQFWRQTYDIKQISIIKTFYKKYNIIDMVN